MTIHFYFDENMQRPVAKGVINHGYEVVMAIDVDMVEKDDDTEHLPYATEKGMVLVTFDRPFAGRTEKRDDHSGLICISENLRKNIGGCIRVLVEFAENHTPEDTKGVCILAEALILLRHSTQTDFQKPPVPACFTAKPSTPPNF